MYQTPLVGTAEKNGQDLCPCGAPVHVGDLETRWIKNNQYIINFKCHVGNRIDCYSKCSGAISGRNTLLDWVRR